MRSKIGIRAIACLWISVTLLPITGCWDYKNIDRMNYFTTMGIDYEDGQFNIYFQSSHFAGITKKEGDPGTTKPKDVIGIGKGNSIGEAIFHMYQSEQLATYWGHLKTIIFTKRALQEINLVALTDLINRYREIRYNLWVFGTEEPLVKILGLLPYYNRSLYDSLLMKPYDTYKQTSYIKPIYLYRFMSDSLEKGKIAMIPILSPDNSTWLEAGKSISLLKMSGEYFLDQGRFLGELPLKQLNGKQYLDQGMYRVLLAEYEGNKSVVSFIVKSSSNHIGYRIQNDRLHYEIRVKVKVFLEEMIKDFSEDEMKAMIRKSIEQKIRNTYEQGKRFETDVLNLGYPIYKYHHRDWKKYIRDRGGVIATDISKITVDVKMSHSGKYKARSY